MIPAASGKYAALADPPGPPALPLAFLVRLRLDIRIDITVPGARDEEDAAALARALWETRRCDRLTLAGHAVQTARLIGCEWVEPLE